MLNYKFVANYISFLFPTCPITSQNSTEYILQYFLNAIERERVWHVTVHHSARIILMSATINAQIFKARSRCDDLTETCSNDSLSCAFIVIQCHTLYNIIQYILYFHCINPYQSYLFVILLGREAHHEKHRTAFLAKLQRRLMRRNECSL